jgi:hypothetical protein
MSVRVCTPDHACSAAVPWRLTQAAIHAIQSCIQCSGRSTPNTVQLQHYKVGKINIYSVIHIYFVLTIKGLQIVIF